MAFLDSPINASDLPEDVGGFEPLPAGDYQCRIGAAEIKATKDGNGQYVKLSLDVIGPSHSGRKLFANLNIRNASAKAEEIGRQQLGALMRAIGLPTLTDTDQLIGGIFIAKVTVKNDEKYGAGNEIKAYKACEGSAVPAGIPKAAAQAATPKASPPWAKK